MAMTLDLFRHSENFQRFEPGQVVFSEGDVGDEMWVVQEGQVEIRAGGEVREVVGPGGIFGEMALVDGRRRSATAVAVGDSRLVPVSDRQFDFLIQQTPRFARFVMAVLADRLRRANQE